MRLVTQIALCPVCQPRRRTKPDGDYLYDVRTPYLVKPGSKPLRSAGSIWPSLKRRKSERLSAGRNRVLPNVAPILPQPSIYAKLPSDHHIRLLKLESGTLRNRLSCQLEVCDIDDVRHRQYTAISYTWGAPRKNFKIRITQQQEGSYVTRRVGKNLHRLLHELRDAQDDRLLWVDALCINQDDQTEKNHQIRLMGKIYQEANIVEVWLGADADKAKDTICLKRAFDGMRAAVKYNGPHKPLRLADANAGVTNAQRYFNSDDFGFAARYPGATPSDLHRRFWESFDMFCKREYWKRRWIIQEVLLAKTVVIRMDQHVVDMRMVEDFFDQVQGNPYHAEHEFCIQWQERFGKDLFSTPARSLVRHLLDRSGRRGKNVELSRLRELIPRYFSSECLQPCDNVYALYNLVGEHRKHLEIQYEATPWEQISGILRFMQDYEDVQSYQIAHWASTLWKLFTRTMKSAQWGPCLDAYEIVFHDLGEVDRQEESEISGNARRSVTRMAPISNIRSDITGLFSPSSRDQRREYTGRNDLVFGRLADLDLLTLSDAFQPGDRVWQLCGTDVYLVVRRNFGGELQAVGRARVFTRGEVPIQFPETAPKNAAFHKALKLGSRCPMASVRIELHCLLQLAALVEKSFDAEIGERVQVHGQVPRPPSSSSASSSSSSSPLCKPQVLNLMDA